MRPHFVSTGLLRPKHTLASPECKRNAQFLPGLRNSLQVNEMIFLQITSSSLAFCHLRKKPGPTIQVASAKDLPVKLRRSVITREINDTTLALVVPATTLGLLSHDPGHSSARR